MLHQIERILIDPVSSSALEFILPIPAGEYADSQCPGALCCEKVPYTVAHHDGRMNVHTQPFRRGENMSGSGLACATSSLVMTGSSGPMSRRRSVFLANSPRPLVAIAQRAPAWSTHSAVVSHQGGGAPATSAGHRPPRAVSAAPQFAPVLRHDLFPAATQP